MICVSFVCLLNFHVSLVKSSQVFSLFLKIDLSSSFRGLRAFNMLDTISLSYILFAQVFSPIMRLVFYLSCIFWKIWCSPDADAGKGWRQEEKGTTEEEMVGWHHWLDGHEFEQAPRVGDRQGSLACCNPWGSKEANMIEPTELNWTETKENKIKFCDVVV